VSLWKALRWWLPRAGFSGLAKSVGRKLRGGGLRGLASSVRFHLSKFEGEQALYARWIKESETPSRNADQARLEMESLKVKPVFSILVPVYNVDARWLRRAIESVLAQTYPCWELCLVDDASTLTHVKPLLEEYRGRDRRVRVVYRIRNGRIAAATNSALEIATGDYAVLMDSDDEIAVDALLEFAKRINQDGFVDMIYSDEDKITDEGTRMEPFFKPDWSPDYLESYMYTAHLACYKMELVRAVGGFREEFQGAQDYDFVLRFTEQANKIAHVPKVLYHSRYIPGSTGLSVGCEDHALNAAGEVLSEHLIRTARRGVVRQSPYPGCLSIEEEIRNHPLVSIVIPSAGRDALIRGKRTDLLANCVSSIRQHTEYKNYEIIVVDNDDLRPETRKMVDSCGCEVLHFREPFNVARKMNLGAQRAHGEYLLFLNDDIELIDASWLGQMLQLGQRHGVGAVGAKLLFEDNTLQHVGVTFDDAGLPDHILRGHPADHPGYFFSNVSTRNYLAVTGACMMTRKEIFERVGGFNEAFAVNYNDIDYCLRVYTAGYRTVLAPRARLYHFESRTRERSVAIEEIELFEQLWAGIAKTDPYYSPCMDNKPANFLPRIRTNGLQAGEILGLAREARAVSASQG